MCMKIDNAQVKISLYVLQRHSTILIPITIFLLHRQSESESENESESYFKLRSPTVWPEPH